MNSRDDFSEETKRILASRAGYKCSFPGCNVTTVGPSNESESSVSRTGMACHIAAAAGGQGARRYRPEMTAEERKAINNGIWMCYTHGKLIDTDEKRFTIEMLTMWKAIAERRAQYAQENAGAPEVPLSVYNDLTLAPNEISVSSDIAINEAVGQALHDSGVQSIWGPDLGDILRDLIVEIGRNAVTHGKASRFSVTITPNAVCLSDDGQAFDPFSLRGNGISGGTVTVNYFKKMTAGRLITFGEHRAGKNETTIALVRTPDDVLSLTPCSVSVDHQLLHQSEFKIVIEESCKYFLVVLPRFICVSDLPLLKAKLPASVKDGSKELIFLVKDTSDFVLGYMPHFFPLSTVIRI